MLISSTQNPKIKALLALQQKSSERRAQGLFVVEGQRELQHCIEAGLEIDTVFHCPELGYSPLPTSPERGGVSASPSLPTSPERGGTSAPSLFIEKEEGGLAVSVTKAVYERIAYRGTTEGVVAIVKAKPLTLSDLKLEKNPLIIVLESVEKPGNLGAILRSADAAGADAVIVCDPLTDLYNPNLIRSSIGAIFTVPCVACSSEECIAFLKKHDIQILTAQLQDSLPYYDTDMQQATAIIMGTESTGLTDQWRKAATAHIRIPMLGRLDSLNVSVSAAILLYEAVRQRNTKAH